MTLYADRLESQPQKTLFRYFYHRSLAVAEVWNYDDIVLSEYLLLDIEQVNNTLSAGCLFIGNERVSHDVAAKWRATRWWGVDIGDPEIRVLYLRP